MLDVSRHDPVGQRSRASHVVITGHGREALPGQCPLRVPARARPDGAAGRAPAPRALGRLAAGAVHGPKRPARVGLRPVNGSVRVACVQAEPVILDRGRTIERLESLTAEAAGGSAELVVFPETFVPAYPSSAWAKFLAGWADPRAKSAFAQLARESVDVPGPDCDRLGEIAREHRGLAGHRRQRARPAAARDALQLAPLPRPGRKPRPPPSQAHPDEPRADGLGPG